MERRTSLAHCPTCPEPGAGWTEAWKAAALSKASCTPRYPDGPARAQACLQAHQHSHTLRRWDTPVRILQPAGHCTSRARCPGGVDLCPAHPLGAAFSASCKAVCAKVCGLSPGIHCDRSPPALPQPPCTPRGLGPSSPLAASVCLRICPWLCLRLRAPCSPLSRPGLSVLLPLSESCTSTTLCSWPGLAASGTGQGDTMGRAGWGRLCWWSQFQKSRCSASMRRLRLQGQSRLAWM